MRGCFATGPSRIGSPMGAANFLINLSSAPRDTTKWGAKMYFFGDIFGTVWPFSMKPTAFYVFVEGASIPLSNVTNLLTATVYRRFVGSIMVGEM